MSSADLFRLYDLRLFDEFDSDGYPLAWQEIKYLVRGQAGNRCVRCHHPYRVDKHGKGEWTPCDVHCAHLGEVRMKELCRPGEQEWRTFDLDRIGQYAGEGIYDYGPDGRQVERWLVEAHWRILTVHHLDGVKANLRWWNLVALCQRCHLGVQSRVKMDRPWPWPHSAWMRPYVAGFYALKYLAEDLTREETEARLDELLALGLEEEAVERMPL